MILSAFFIAATAILAPMRPEPGKPLEWEAELSEEETAAFDDANSWVGVLYERRRLWNEFLDMMRLKESVQSTAGVRWTLTYKDRVWAFDAYGHYWSDSRFVLDRETDGLENLEAWFKEFLERSPYAGFEWMKEEGETMSFRGFDEGRFRAADFVIMKVCERFNANPSSLWPGNPPAKIASIHEMHPRLLKSLIIEENFAEFPAGLDEAGVETVLRELAECGFNEGGRFEGWFNAIKDYGSRHAWRNEDEYSLAQYADRVTRRFENPGIFVPVLTRKGKDE